MSKERVKSYHTIFLNHIKNKIWFHLIKLILFIFNILTLNEVLIRDYIRVFNQIEFLQQDIQKICLLCRHHKNKDWLAVTLPFGEKHIVWSCIQPFIVRKFLLSLFVLILHKLRWRWCLVSSTNFAIRYLVISSAQEYLKSSHQTAFLRGPLTPNPLMASARPLPWPETP